ncbi:MAG: glycosyltransferase family 1 protein [Sphingomonas bacterium]|uniref:glycosyltransferase family 4 protein n=1 Tax=Sphingomonas bacterium TaxID=1895847 RepID=UPI00262385EF|nr:glycosyltransferase family 1 protein [Sphingomonas bacterium]MDB5695743.1 glycosyltransferase family 1 protein [Sphingomonas bacterium]
MQPSDLRVALFSGNYNYTRDGPTQALNLLVGFLLRHGVAVRIYAPTTSVPAFEHTGDLVSVRSIALPGERGEYRMALGLPGAIRRDLKAFGPTIVHLSAPDILGHRAVSWARARHIPCVASLHTRFETYLRYYHAGMLEPLLVGVQKRFYERVDRVMPPAESMAAVVRGWGVKTPMAIWSRGIDHDRFTPARRDLAWRRSLGLGDDDVAVGFLGRVVKEKGLDVFAEVMAKLRRRGVPARTLVVGEGPAQAWFAEQVPDAVFAGFQSGDDLGRAVASMDVFFNPSVTETFGNVTLEAMAAGVPVVAANATGAIDLVEPGITGFLVPPRDCEAYADAIARIVAQPDLRAGMGAAGHHKASGYRWDAANQAVLDVYLELATQAANQS